MVLNVSENEVEWFQAQSQIVRVSVFRPIKGPFHSDSILTLQ